MKKIFRYMRKARFFMPSRIIRFLQNFRLKKAVLVAIESDIAKIAKRCYFYLEVLLEVLRKSASASEK